LSDGTITIAKAVATSYTWDKDIKPIFATYCLECHGEPARSAGLESFRLDKYDAADQVAPVNDDLGAYEMRTQVYTRTITQANMPPAAEPKPSQAQRDMIAMWIQGGAPKGGGPADPRPTFTWIKPSATQPTGTTVDLQWSAMDNTGLLSGVVEYKKLNGTPSSGCSSAGTTGWAAVTDPMATATLGGAPTWAVSITWTLPNTTTGYYCFRGRVTDTANQETIVINPNGVK
jgi:hypothetical protein